MTQRIFALFFFFSITFNTNSQLKVGVFYTYEDFINNDYDPMDFSKVYTSHIGLYNPQGKLVTVKYSKMWGYLHRNDIVRVMPDRKLYLVFSIGKIITYINTDCTFNIYKNKKYFEPNCLRWGFSNIRTFYISEDLNSAILPIQEDKWEPDVKALLTKGLRDDITWEEFSMKNGKEMPIVEKILRYIQIDKINGRGINVDPDEISINIGEKY